MKKMGGYNGEMVYISSFKSTYKYVYGKNILVSGKKQIKFMAQIRQLNKQKYFDTEKDAAIQIDKWLLLSGQNPVNILKKK